MSTYGSFSYLKYGPLRLFSQLAQDSDLRLGRLLYVAGHSGPETAEDSRTHFGIFEPGVMQLFPAGHVIELHPWEHNEVPVMLAAAFRTAAPIVVLHLTRPPIALPDRAAMGMPSHLAAARGAYVMREYRPNQPHGGTVFVRGTLSTQNVVALFPEMDRRGLNVRVVAAQSEGLFRLQDADYRDRWPRMPTGSMPWWSPTARSGSCATGHRVPWWRRTRWARTGTIAGAPAAPWTRSSRRRTWTRGTSWRGSSGSSSDRELRLGAARSALEAAANG